MRSSKKTAIELLRALAALALVLVAPVPAAASPLKQPATVVEVVTGDTIRLKGGQSLKYIGLEAPPLQSAILLVREYGQASLDFNKQLVEGKSVEIEWDSQIRDKYGNLLGYVYLPDGTLVNERVLREGHAKASIVPPNTRHAGLFRQAEIDARRRKAGLWREEPKNPYLNSEFVGDKMTHIYYLPTSPELERIPAGHTETFRSRIDAVKAGYKPCDACRQDTPTEI